MSEDLERIREQSPDVIAYRLSVLENEVNQVDRKLDSFIALYPSKELLDIMLAPMNKTIEGLSQRIASIHATMNEQEKAKSQERSQLKIMLLATVISPIMTAVIAFLIGVQYK